MDHTRSLRLHEDLRARAELPQGSGGEEAWTASPELRDAVARVEACELAQDLVCADDEATIARALADAEQFRREAAQHDEARSALEETRAAVHLERLEQEAEAERLERQATLIASRRAAEDELRRAFARAEQDEAAPRRARHVGLSEAPERVRLAEAIEVRAALLLQACVLLGLESVGAEREALLAARNERDAEQRLRLASEAYAAARLALGRARRARGVTPSPQEVASLVEAAALESFTLVHEASGLGFVLEGVFEGSRIGRAHGPRVARLAALLASHPHGPLIVSVEATSASDVEARRRAESVARALEVGPGAPPERRAMETRVVVGPSPGRVRVILPLYTVDPPVEP